MRTFAWTPAAAVVLLASVSLLVPVYAQDLSKAKPKDIPRLKPLLRRIQFLGVRAWIVPKSTSVSAT